MDEGTDLRNWGDLIPDTLGLIFKNLPLKVILTVIPSVCKAWAKAVDGPYCWQEINIEEWSSQSEPHLIDRMLQMLITRSCGSVRKIHVSCLGHDQTFSLITDHAVSLQTLILQRSNISNSIVEQVAAKLSTISILDLSSCCQIRAPALEAIGKNCKLLGTFKWNMHPLDVEDKPSHADEAHAIAKTMLKLNQLELAYLNIDTNNALDILSCCPELEFLDVRGCWSVKLDKMLLEVKYPKLKVLGPQIKIGWAERRYFDDCLDSSDDWTDWMDYSDDEDDSFDAIWNNEELELRIYDGWDNMQAIGWPPSP